LPLFLCEIFGKLTGAGYSLFIFVSYGRKTIADPVIICRSIMGLVRNIKRIIRKIVRSFKRIAPLYAGKKGLEIGGPSAIFDIGNELPLYAIARQVDGCNLATTPYGKTPYKRAKPIKRAVTL
jgi:hypothetical protein